MTNSGAANPVGRGSVIAEVGPLDVTRSLRIGVVLGDDVLGLFDAPGAISANAYLAARGSCTRSTTAPDVVVTGRVADAALFAGPLVHAHRWASNDWGTSSGSRSGSAISSNAPGR